MSQTISFKVNGIQRTLNIDGWEKLIDVLRMKLQLTGTKRGCDDGACGACVVLVNGEAQKSCILPASKANGAEILTIEGLAQGSKLHPIQTALVEAGAVQCGFCTPGIAMRLYALLNANPDASEEQIVKALSKHLCRCTGYEAILEGAKRAKALMQSENPHR